jgi:hypothetical protein
VRPLAEAALAQGQTEVTVVVTLVGMELVRSATGPAARLGADGLDGVDGGEHLFESCTFATLTRTASGMLREKNANSTGYPIDLPCCGSGNANKHHFGHAMGMSFGVSKLQSRSPGPSKYQPPFDIEVPTQQFDIGEEMSCRVRGEIYVGLARVRRASPRSALIEQNDPIDV